MKIRWSVLLPTLLVVFIARFSAADEGMWLFNHPPTGEVKAKYHFTLTPAWLDHTRLSSVRFNNGGSGSFVSADGLTFTNHHVAQTCLFGLSSKERDLYKAGFYAKSQAEEAKCPDLELNQLVGMEDVTDRVNAGVAPDMPAAQAGIRQRANMNTIEQDCVKATGLRCDVVTLYAGGMFHLYRYKKYTDVRLVFAPEFPTAFFGGDPDNFEYPRYDLDITFFRVYENGQPARLDHFFKWSPSGVRDGELVFVSGNPGSTGRLLTMAQLDYLRDTSYPAALEFLGRRIRLLNGYSAESSENARQAQELLFALQNSFKAVKGYQSGLLDEKLMARKEADEQKLKQAVAGDPKLKQQFDDPWAEIAQAQQVMTNVFVPFTLLERRGGGDLTPIARTLVRGAEERPKPNAERLREFRESNLPSLEQKLFSPAPIYKDLETVLITDWLSELKARLGDDPAVQKLFGGANKDKSPPEIARELIEGSKLDDVAVRKQLWNGGQAAIDASTDPLIAFFRVLDPVARTYRKQYDDRVESVERTDGAKLAKIRFATEGLNLPPDATFTLRLSYGAVEGYTEDGRGDVATTGARVPYFTTLEGAYKHSARHGGKPPYDLAPSWIAAKDKLKLNTPLDFVSTPDIIGGNSGSPVVNEADEVVGIIFDGNIQSLPWRFAYEDKVGRSVAVDVRGIVEALRNVYHADRVADELSGTSAASQGSKKK